MARRYTYSSVPRYLGVVLDSVATDEQASRYAAGIAASEGLELRPVKWTAWGNGRRVALVYGRKPGGRRSRYLGTLHSREVRE